DRVDAEGEDLVGGPRRDAETAGGVLPVDDDEVELELLAQPGEQRGERPPAYSTDHVADEEQSHPLRILSQWRRWLCEPGCSPTRSTRPTKSSPTGSARLTTTASRSRSPARARPRCRRSRTTSPGARATSSRRRATSSRGWSRAPSGWSS